MNSERILSYKLSQELTEAELDPVAAGWHWTSLQVGGQRGGGYVQVVMDS